MNDARSDRRPRAGTRVEFGKGHEIEYRPYKRGVSRADPEMAVATVGLSADAVARGSAR